MKKVMVFGAGLIGGFIANWLSKKYTVLAYDGNIKAVQKLSDRLSYSAYFFKDKEDIMESINNWDPDIVVNAFPGHIGYDLLECSILLGRDIVDISFMSEDPLKLNKVAVKNNVTAVVDFGFAPGFSHMFVSRANKLLDKHDESIIYVGGLQLGSDEYKAPFSPVDIIQEYTRPARYLKDGKIETELPFWNRYEYETFYCFINDGLRTLAETLDIPNIIELTLRPKTHFKFIQSLIENGFFKEEHLESTTKVLTEKWKMTEKDRDHSILDVVSKGDGKTIRHSMYDQYDVTTKTHSMARVTGFPVIAMVEAILEGKYTEKGVIPPEYVAKNDEVYNFVVGYLQKYGITIIEDLTGGNNGNF